MPFATATIISASAAIAGLGLSAKSYSDQKEANQQVTEASQRAEAIRAEQARVNALREQRKIFQDAQRARAYANSTAATQGASSSSGVEGAFATIAGAQGAQSATLSENYGLGQQTFEANTSLTDARSDLSTAQGLGDIGKTLFSSSEKIGAVGSTLYNKVK